MKNLPPKILLATANQGKVKELRDLVQGLPVQFVSLVELPDFPEVIEDQDTFEANALKKARTIAKAAGMVTLADDSGLCVDALGGRPGVYSARYAGEHATDAQKCLRILDEMRHVPDGQRNARFVCVLALVVPDGEENLFLGVCEGRITKELRGSAGFGYDPIFLFEPEGLTFAEMDRDAKNRVSHRGNALREFASFMKGLAR